MLHTDGGLLEIGSAHSFALYFFAGFLGFAAKSLYTQTSYRQPSVYIVAIVLLIFLGAWRIWDLYNDYQDAASAMVQPTDQSNSFGLTSKLIPEFPDAISHYAIAFAMIGVLSAAAFWVGGLIYDKYNN